MVGSTIVVARRGRSFALDQIRLWIKICAAAVARRRRTAQSLADAQPDLYPTVLIFIDEAEASRKGRRNGRA